MTMLRADAASHDEWGLPGDDPVALPERRQKLRSTKSDTGRGARNIGCDGDSGQGSARHAHAAAGTHRAGARHRNYHKVNIYRNGHDASHRQSIRGAPD